MTNNLAKWTSEHGQTSKIGPSDGCGRDAVLLAGERCYDFPEFGGYLGNVGLLCYTVRRAGCINEISIELRPNTRALDRSVVARRRGKI